MEALSQPPTFDLSPVSSQRSHGDAVQGRPWPWKSSHCQATTRAGFLFFPLPSVFYSLSPLSWLWGGLTFWRGSLGTRALCKKRWSGRALISGCGPISANWDWAQEHVFFLGAKIKKNNTLWYKCVLLIDVTQKDKEQVLCVHCYFRFIRLIFFFFFISFYCMGFMLCLLHLSTFGNTQRRWIQM